VELHLFERDLNKPYFIFILTHLKSPLDPEGIDSQGAGRRTAEFRTLLEIYGELRQQFSNTPIAICGDLNGNASRYDTDREFSELYKTTDLEDVLELAGVPRGERVTFFPMKSGVLLPGRQIDFVLFSEAAKPYLDHSKTSVFRYDILLRGRPLGPQTYEEKQSLPSDHYPILFKLKDLKT
jgi:hypothetical protein